MRSVREGRRVRQKIVGTLGRRDELVASGQLDGLLRSLSTFSEKLAVVDKARALGLRAHSAKAWGQPLVFQRLWERQGIPDVIARLAKGRRFEFDVERCVFAMALQRLMAPGSDLPRRGSARSKPTGSTPSPFSTSIARPPFSTTCGRRSSSSSSSATAISSARTSTSCSSTPRARTSTDHLAADARRCRDRS